MLYRPSLSPKQRDFKAFIVNNEALRSTSSRATCEIGLRAKKKKIILKIKIQATFKAQQSKLIQSYIKYRRHKIRIAIVVSTGPCSI